LATPTTNAATLHPFRPILTHVGSEARYGSHRASPKRARSGESLPRTPGFSPRSRWQRGGESVSTPNRGLPWPDRSHPPPPRGPLHLTRRPLISIVATKPPPFASESEREQPPARSGEHRSYPAPTVSAAPHGSQQRTCRHTPNDTSGEQRGPFARPAHRVDRLQEWRPCHDTRLIR
jgi:hypothetical protein